MLTLCMYADSTLMFPLLPRLSFQLTIIKINKYNFLS